MASSADSKISRRVADLEDSFPAMESRIADLETKVAEIPALLARIAELEARPGPTEVSVVSARKGVTGSAGRPKKEKLPAPPLPEGEEAPGPEAYRLKEADIKEGVCIARAITSSDKRWSIEIMAESQCGAAVEEGEELCAACAEKAARYEEDKKFRKWHGTVLEEPLSWMHMLGTAWATQAMEGGRLRWLGGEAAVGGAGTGDSASMTSGDSGASGSKMSVAEKRAALKAEKDAKKAEEKAAKAAAAEAKKAAAAEAKAAKEAAAAEAKAAKAAEKAAKPPKKPAAGAASKKVPKPAEDEEDEEAVTAPARADTSAAVAKVKGSVEPLGDELYWREGRKMFAYDMMDGKGAFLGMLAADGETITPCDKEPDSDDEE